MAGVRIELIGRTRIVGADGHTVELERRSAALLAFLVLEGRTERRRLAELLWPDKDPDKARNNLRQRLFNLRRDSGHPLIQGEDALAVAADVENDVTPAQARPARPPGAAALELLHGHRYDDLEELDEWVAQARARWHATRRRAQVQAVDGHERAGRIADAIAAAGELLEDDPHGEETHRRLMRLHYLDGDRGAALAVYERWRAIAQLEARARSAGDIENLARLIERSDALVHAARSAPPLTLLRTPRLVAREAEWVAIERALQRQRAVLLRGEPGIGKSRLARDFARAHGDALVCGARPSDTAQPYALLARLLRALVERFGAPPPGAVVQELARVVPELGTPPAAPADALRLGQALHESFASWMAQGWAGVVVDDLQFADPASIEALVDWLDDERARGLNRLLTVRMGEVPPALAHWLEAGAGEACVEITLPALDETGLQALLDSLELPGLEPVPWAGRLLRHTGGNPLFVIETLRACLDGGGLAAFADHAAFPAPEGVGRAIERRLARLSADALRLARAAALVGPDCGANVIAAVLGCHPIDLADAWHELEARQVMRDGAFAHDLVLEAVVRSVPAEIARAIHDAAARELEARDYPAARIAPHWRSAQRWPQAARQFLRAADGAAAQSRRDDEIGLLEQAAACCDQCGDRAGAFAARVRRADAMVVAGSMALADAEIARLAAAAAEEGQQLAVAILRARASLAGADGTGAERGARDALELAERLGDRDQRFRAQQLLGSALSLRGDAAGALGVLEPLLHAEGARRAPREACELHGSLGYVLATTGRRRAAAEHLREAARLAEELGDHAEAMTLLTNLAGTSSMLGDVANAAVLAQKARTLSLHGGEKAGIAVASNETILGLAYTALGRFGEAEDVLLAALDRFRRAGAPVWTVATEGMLANLYVMLGQVTRARRALGPVPESIPAARRARRLVVEARIEQAGGASGLATLRRAVALLEGANRSMDQLGATLVLAAACEPAEALPMLREAQARCIAQELDAVLVTARVREADVLRRLGERGAAAALAHELVATAGRCWPNDLYRGEFWWVLFEVLDATGETRAAEGALAAGVEWVQSVVPHVPADYRDGFLHRQRVNRALLTTASRRLRAMPARPG